MRSAIEEHSHEPGGSISSYDCIRYETFGRILTDGMFFVYGDTMITGTFLSEGKSHIAIIENGGLHVADTFRSTKQGDISRAV